MAKKILSTLCSSDAFHALAYERFISPQTTSQLDDLSKEIRVLGSIHVFEAAYMRSSYNTRDKAYGLLAILKD